MLFRTFSLKRGYRIGGSLRKAMMDRNIVVSLVSLVSLVSHRARKIERIFKYVHRFSYYAQFVQVNAGSKGNRMLL